MHLSFYGASQTVTGSRYLIEYEGRRYLIDCGLFQGYKKLRLRNWEPFPVPPKSVDAIVLTHAHIDHSGYIPRFVKEGFEGKVYCTPATRDLCRILLEDSGYLQEEEARRANRYGYSRHSPASPLYTMRDAVAALEQFAPIDFGQNFRLAEGLDFRFHRSGHILGAACIVLSARGRKILFSGDVGRLGDPVMYPPEDPVAADYLVVESTYGNRLHSDIDPIEQLGGIIQQTAAKGGTVLIPSFAVGRTQNILYYLSVLKKRGAIPDLPIYLDSPMAIDASELFCKHASEHQLTPEACREVCHGATYVRDVMDSKALDSTTFPSIIISASGMATGGRVLHHLKYFLGNSDNTVLFAGYQAGGTRGSRLVNGEREIKIHGRMYSVEARIETLTNTSAHADYEELLTWLRRMPTAPRKVFVTHGEASASEALCHKLKESLGWNAVAPEFGHREILWK